MGRIWISLLLTILHIGHTFSSESLNLTRILASVVDAKPTLSPPTTTGTSRSRAPREKPITLSDILPDDPSLYDKMAPPKVEDRPTIVRFHVTVMSLDSIDESSMTFVADVFFAQSWEDYRLQLPENMTGGYRLLPVSWLNEVWRPDSFFKNAKKVTFQEMTIPNHYVWIYNDSTILYMVKLNLLLSCAMNFKTYPHDTQSCALKIESLSHTTDDLVFLWDSQIPLVVDRIELPQLDLVKNETGDCTQVYSTGNFTCLEVIFTLKRRLGYYLFHTYIPTCLIVIMSWISFWIKPEAVPARVTLGVTSLLTLSTQHANSQKSLPPVSYIKAIDVFMSTCTIFVFFSLMEYALINVILGDFVDSDQSMLKRSFRSMTKRFSTRLRRSKNKTRKGSNVSRMSDGGQSASELEDAEAVVAATAAANSAKYRLRTDHQTCRRRAILVDQVSRILFPFLFSVFNAAYWIIYIFIYVDEPLQF
ncbi:glycine receptor subunit alpha-2-like [Neocloeon triangulifer]|uniref:glycine receptor subunit alpha-2-like n=1 Tax=Neocloeon triangulifer TaxID=2078957 RepID=UPI00286ED0B5|nr:glycine receptor subunit alpha-2-like [Neocloeon triangulifer]